MNIQKKLLALVTAVALSSAAQAINFDLVSANADLLPGNPGDSAFYHINGDGTDAGSAASLYSSVIGGDADTGRFLTVSFDGNPQPVLTSAFLKIANSYLFWDAADLSAFNAGTFTSITLWNAGPNGIVNGNGQFQEISHGGLNGTPGTDVPDGGATAALLGLGFLGLAAISRKRS